MAEENTDANTGTETAEDTGSSPDVELSPIIDSEGLVSTMEYEAAPEADSKEETTPDDAGQNTSDQESKTKDFHEHPRFKEIIAERNQQRAENEQLRQRMAEYEQKKQSPAIEDPFTDKSDEDLIDLFTENPRDFVQSIIKSTISNLDTRTAQQREIEAQQEMQTRQVNTVKDFFKGKEDEVQKLYPDIKKYVAEHPGHNAISAYMALTEETRMKAATEKAKKQFMSELKAKGNARSFTSTPGSPTTRTTKAPEMQDPNKFGGRTSVLAQRMKQRMAEG